VKFTGRRALYVLVAIMQGMMMSRSSEQFWGEKGV